MKSIKTLRQVGIALMLLVTFLVQGTWALAGTTGGLTGVVVDEKNAPVSGAAVTATAPSGSATSTTDASGHFVFVSLAPDTYTVSVTKTGYAPISSAGISVFADQTQTISLATHLEALKEIGNVTSRSATSLVKSGTTSDVYSVNASQAEKMTGLGGGGGLDNAYSAIASVPGAYVPVGQSGWFQAVYIRGGDYDQVGYEFDGVPVNRSFDNYPSTNASALGQQELQVYTGAAPANSEGQGLAGFINQVIRTGTYPGFGDSQIGLGAPIFYHKLNGEAGGASPNRLFSYYVGLGGYNEGSRYYDQSNGAGIPSTVWGTPFDFGPCAAAGDPGTGTAETGTPSSA
ncbi:MAG: carboxypeptidase regulatory-like domain-containing protein, partial [Candidatus Baltobacteraceae bacterium]